MASKILLADDSITIQKVVNLTFADEGIEVVAVSNGDLAERRLADVKPDLVLADIFMPGKNGYELCETIKENPQFCNVPVVLLVGAFEPFDQNEARRVKADAHLTKPFESRTLVETVRRLINASSRTSGPPAPQPAAENGQGDALAPLSVGAFEPPINPSLSGKLDLSAMVATSVASSNPQDRNTGELASPSPEAGSNVLGFGIIDATAPDAGKTLTYTSQPSEPLEFSPNGDLSAGELAPSFDLHVGDSHANEETQVFNSQEPIDVSPVQNPTLFTTVAPKALNNVDISGSGEGEHSYNTGGLESSRRSDDAVWRAPNNGSPLSYQPPDFNLQTETGFSVSEATTETACATLLAVDEPLGDLLFDEAVPADSVVPTDMSSSDSPGLELGEEGVAVAVFEPSTQFDLVEIVETPPAASAPAVEENNAEQFSAEALEHVMADAVDEVAAPQAPVSNDVLESIAAPSHPEAHNVSQEAVGELDWTTPRAASYSTAQLDSVVMPINTAEYLTENSSREDVQQPADIEEAVFTTPATWTEEEARFTPIDIEGVAVEDTLVDEGSSLVTASAADLNPAEQPTPNSETFVDESTETASSELQGAPVSSAAIEEIVRRVVAEMSESVVREIAWEVVPDCVERVIEQLTRESLSKRA